MVLLKLLGLVVGAAGGLVAYKLHSRKDKKAYVSRCRTAAAQWAGSDDELAAFFLERGQKAGAGTERPIKQLVHDAMFGEVVNEWSLGEATEMQVRRGALGLFKLPRLACISDCMGACACAPLSRGRLVNPPCTAAAAGMTNLSIP